MTRQYPDDPAALHAAALLYKDLQKTVEAKQIWERCVAMAPPQPGPYIGLASAQMELGEDQQAVATLQQAIRSGHEGFDIYLELGAALTKLGQIDQAAEALEQAVSADPRNAEGWLQLGQAQSQLQSFAAAEASLQKAIQLGTQTPSVYFALANVSARQGKTEDAAKYREEFVRRKEADPSKAAMRFRDRYDSELRRIAVAAICRAGTVCVREGDAEQAERLFLRALALDPANPVVCAEMATFYRKAGRIADARLAQSRLVRLDPRHMMHHVNLASLASQLGDARSAEASLQAAIQLRPDLAIGYVALAQVYFQQGDWERARRFSEMALLQTPASVEERLQTYVVLAEACQKMGDDAAAEQARLQAEQIAASLPAGQAPSSPRDRLEN
jgi:tetratricopeptide (TPR) repeat protein